ncbi:hypothetical protein BvCmsNSNP030_3844 [Escherichia coli]|nr:hypothetical protein BvCmsNSNP030_3844 [Escherichia coli]
MRDWFIKTMISASILSFLSVGYVSLASAELKLIDKNIWMDEFVLSGSGYSIREGIESSLKQSLNADVVFFDKNKRVTNNREQYVYYASLPDVVNTINDDIQSKTLVGENSDGTLTRADGAGKTISVNDGLVKLSGRTDKIDAAVGDIDGRVTNNTQSIGENSKTIASVNDGLGKLTGRTDKIDAAVGDIDGRVTNNTQSINKNNKAIASNTRTLQQHSARLDKQQRQINENHKEMKRAAAQSAALTGLFQPYSVGKFNATAAVGGYSDQQAMAVGVGYRFNEQTAAKAGVAFSDGDASWNVGVNFEF